MALTRKFLSALGIEQEKIDEIINAHTETVDALKHERDAFKADAEKLSEVQEELNKAKSSIEANEGKNPWKVKYDALKEDFDSYKADITAKETKANKSNAYRELLKNAGVAEKRIEAVLKVSDIDKIELDKDGKIKDADKLTEGIKVEWADFITSESTKGAKTATPPANDGGTIKSREEIYKTDEHGHFLLDASQRQAALVQLNATQQKG